MIHDLVVISSDNRIYAPSTQKQTIYGNHGGMTIQAQQATGSTSTGGTLNLKSGTGTCKNKGKDKCQHTNIAATHANMNGKRTIQSRWIRRKCVLSAKPKQ